MTTINLKDFYPWYTHDEFIDVSDEVAEELLADKRYNKTHERAMRRNKVHSLESKNNFETIVITCNSDNPETIIEAMERCCRLCCALNSLPEAQGRRIDAHYMLGKSQLEIAKEDGVTKESVNISIMRGLVKMKRNYEDFDFQSNFCPKSVLIYERNFSLSKNTYQHKG